MMANFNDVMKIKIRMCDSDACCDCPIFIDKIGCAMNSAQHLEYAENAILAWGKENPEQKKKTMLEVLNERLPTLRKNGDYPEKCPSFFFGIEYCVDCARERPMQERPMCKICWDRPAPEEYQCTFNLEENQCLNG